MHTLKRLVVAFTLCATVLVVAPMRPAEAASAIQIIKIEYNPPGSDTGSNAHRNLEYVAIRNTGSTRRDLTGWTLKDASGHVFHFPAGYRLGAGSLVRIRTGNGTNTGMTLYWNSGSYIWNNTGDTATLRSAMPTTADKCTYSDSDTSDEYKMC